MKRIGKWIAIVSVVLAILCVAPAIYYVMFASSGGDARGTVLLLIFGAPVFAGFAFFGLLLWLIGTIRVRRCNT